RALRLLGLYKEPQLLLAVLDLVRSEALISLLFALPLSRFPLGGFPPTISCPPPGGLTLSGLTLSGLTLSDGLPFSSPTTLGGTSAPTAACFPLGRLTLGSFLGGNSGVFYLDPAAVCLPVLLEELSPPLRGGLIR